MMRVAALVVSAIVLALPAPQVRAQNSPLDLLREITRPLPKLFEAPRPATRAAPRASRPAPSMPTTLTVLPRLRPTTPDSAPGEALVELVPRVPAPPDDPAALPIAPPDPVIDEPGIMPDDERFASVPIAPPGRFLPPGATAAEASPEFELTPGLPALAYASDALPMPRARPVLPSAIAPMVGNLPVPPPSPSAAAPAPAQRIAAAAPLAALVAVPPLPRRRPARSPATRVSAVPGEPKGPANAGCAADLIALGVVADRVAPISNGVCGIAAPYRVTAFGGGKVALTQPATLTCQTAREVARWLRDQAGPAAYIHLRGEITGLRVAASYVCRTRNSVPGARISEHAMGRAIDISAIRVSGRGWLTVGSEKGSPQRFLAASRRAACGPFKTVLGPGSDSYHSDHFHLDLAQRRRGGTYCSGMPEE